VLGSNLGRVPAVFTHGFNCFAQFFHASSGLVRRLCPSKSFPICCYPAMRRFRVSAVASLTGFQVHMCVCLLQCCIGCQPHRMLKLFQRFVAHFSCRVHGERGERRMQPYMYVSDFEICLHHLISGGENPIPHGSGCCSVPHFRSLFSRTSKLQSSRLMTRVTRVQTRRRSSNF
jgi:hypothetical protein